MLPVLFACGLALVATVLVVAWWSVNHTPGFRIAGCCALVTGGSAGIGLETARQLVRQGAKVVVIAARRADILQEAAEDLRREVDANGTQVLHVVMDVSDEASVTRAVDEIKRLTAHTSGLDLVVCNAGFAIPARFLDTTPEEMRRIMDVNFFGCVHVVRAVLPDMLRRRHGRIVLVSSLAARCPIAGYSVYGASKAAVRAFAHSLDMESSWMGVRFQVVSPQDVETPGLQTEDLRKSPECRAISSFGGAVPLKADAMGRRIVEGIADYRFDVFTGADATLLGWGSAGIEPATNLVELLAQFFLSGWLRLVMVVFSKLHYGIVRRVRTDEEKAAGGKKRA